MRTIGRIIKKLYRYWFWMGLLAVLATAVPYVLLGRDAVFTYHDQLDGELIAYLLQARHLFRGDILPEFLGGVSKTALIPPAPLCVLLFLPGDGYLGLMLMSLTVRVFGYVGMYLLCRDVVKEPPIAAVTGILYACVPFLPVYGLSEFGIPMLFWCILQIRNGRRLFPAYCYVAFYTLCSSLVLVGFGLLGMGGLMLVWVIWQMRRQVRSHRDCDQKCFGRLAAAWLLMLGLYVAENFRLLWQLLGNGAVSHKTEYVLNATPFLESLIRGLLEGGQYSQANHAWLLAVTVVTVVAVICGKRIGKDGDLLKVIGFCFVWNTVFVLTAAVWKSSFGVGIRSSLSALGAFQLDRLLWIAPCLWYLAGACGIALAWRFLRGRIRKISTWFCGLLVTAAVCITGVQNLLSGDLRFNIQKLRNPDYSMLSFRDYYAIGVMEQVEAFLLDETGQKQDMYRVVSLGIDPAAALYHGFYCLDGYSNNYPVEYKHAFRRVLEPELEKSDYLKEVYDGWGNRCYLLSSESPNYYTIEKNGFYFQDYRLNTQALQELGGDYLLSAAYILNAEDQDLFLMREVPFETENSYYRIFLYKIGEAQ